VPSYAIPVRSRYHRSLRGCRRDHRGEGKALLAAGAAKRLLLERLPAYAPELNPAEGVWNLL